MESQTNAEEKISKQLYELAYLISSHVPEDKISEVVARIKGVFEKRGMFVVFEEFPRFRQLAYMLVKPLGGKNEKYANAYFGFMRFEAVAADVVELTAIFKKDLDIVRFLVVKSGPERKSVVRPTTWRRDTIKRDSPKVEAPKAQSMTDAEMDKTIEELLVE